PEISSTALFVRTRLRVAQAGSVAKNDALLKPCATPTVAGPSRRAGLQLEGPLARHPRYRQQGDRAQGRTAPEACQREQALFAINGCLCLPVAVGEPQSRR